MTHSITSLALAAALAISSSSHAGDVKQQFLCGPASEYFPGVPTDYRQRNSTDFLKWSIRDNWVNHTEPAIKNIAAGRLTRTVMADLDFTLRRWPNHPDALRALAQYSIAGGKQHGLLPFECYFLFAGQFAPDDAAIRLIEGTWRWRKGSKDGAVEAYQKAIEIDPLYAEAHYNLGLIYVELGKMQDAREHARIAYEQGFPLPGLREKLNERERRPTKQ